MKDKQKVIFLAVFLLVVVGAISTMSFLEFKDRSELLTQMDRYQGQETAAQDKIKRISELFEERAELVATIGSYTKILPPEAHVQHDAFVEIIDGYREDTKILIQKADYVNFKDKNKPDGTAAEESFIRHRYRFLLLGTVPDFTEFVSKIENHTRFLKVDAIKIKPYVPKDGVAVETNPDEKELHWAAQEIKEIELTVSTYTYRGDEVTGGRRE